MAATPAGAVWTKTCLTLKRELGDATFGSWLGHAALRERSDHEVCLVAATGVARDWIRRHAWRRCWSDPLALRPRPAMVLLESRSCCWWDRRSSLKAV